MIDPHQEFPNIADAFDQLHSDMGCPGDCDVHLDTFPDRYRELAVLAENFLGKLSASELSVFCAGEVEAAKEIEARYPHGTEACQLLDDFVEGWDH